MTHFPSSSARFFYLFHVPCMDLFLVIVLFLIKLYSFWARFLVDIFACSAFILWTSFPSGHLISLTSFFFWPSLSWTYFPSGTSISWTFFPSGHLIYSTSFFYGTSLSWASFLAGPSFSVTFSPSGNLPSCFWHSNSSNLPDL